MRTCVLVARGNLSPVSAVEPSTMDDWTLEDDDPPTTRLPRARVPRDDDEDAPVTLRSPESGVVLRPRESQVTFAFT